MPQALPLSLAGMGNYLVGIFKDTPMPSDIGVAELMQVANGIDGSHYRQLEPYTLVGIIFLAISLPAAGLIKVFEAGMPKILGMNCWKICRPLELSAPESPFGSPQCERTQQFLSAVKAAD